MRTSFSSEPDSWHRGGPHTIAAINGAKDAHLRAILNKRQFYYDSRGPRFNKFKKSWRDRNTPLKHELGWAA